MPRFTTSLAMVVALVCGACFGSVTTTGPEEPSSAATEMLRLGLRGVYFVPNRGQWSDADVHFGLRSRGLDVAFRESSFTMHLRRKAGEAGESVVQTASDSPESNAPCDKLSLGVSFPGSNPVLPQGAIPQTTRFNYFVGGEGRGVAGDVPSFGAVVYSNLYDGIDLHVSGNDDGILKYEFHVEPGADYGRVRIAYQGIESLCVDGSDGDLLIDTAFGTLRDAAPIVWQSEGAESQSVQGAPANMPAYRYLAARFNVINGSTYSVTLDDAPDPSLPLVIDPEISWMNYLGGGGYDSGESIAVDSAGNALVAGETESPNFEGRNNSYYASRDAFVLKVSPSGELLWMTYLGGSDKDEGWGVAVDGEGNAVVTGRTLSTDFFGRNNSKPGGWDTFAVKISPSGQVAWMTYLGGSADEYGWGIAVDRAGNATVTGRTGSSDFAGRNNSNYGGSDAFAVKVNPSGQLLWMTYLGGSDSDEGTGIAADRDGNVLVAGWTWSTDFAGGINSYHGGPSDAFSAKVSPSGQFLWMTHLGGTGRDIGTGNAVDGDGDVLVTGFSRSTDFVGRNNSYYGGEYDAFALKVGALGELEWMTFLGGSEKEEGSGIAVDAAGNALVTGNTISIDFAGRNNSYHGSGDAFALQISASGQLRSMTYIGGSIDEEGNGIAVGGQGNVLATGYTDSVDFAGRKNSYLGGRSDAFIAKLRLPGPNLSVDAMCPGGGPIHIAWEGATTGRRVSILFARETGSVSIPHGSVCEGVQLGLGRRQIQVVVKPWSDEFGTGYVEGIAGAIACGGYMQLLDLTSCATSNVVRIE